MKPVFPRIFLLLILTLMLSIVPLPEIMQAFRLPWVCLLFLYIQFFLPQYFNVFLLFMMGLCLDVLLSTVIGEHATALLLVSWMASSKARRIQFFSMGQQMMLVGFFCLIYQVIIIAIDAFLGFDHAIWMPLVCGLSAMFVWPWIRILLDSLLILHPARR